MNRVLFSFILMAVLPACDAPGHRAGGQLGEPSQVASSDLELAAARAYMLELVNADRDSAGLSALTLDVVAQQAAQRHAEDMVSVGFTAHWGSDGSVPEQRYSAAGGTHFVQENAACFFDGQPRELDPNPRFSRASLERIHKAFINETPPNDGHRKNILKPVHIGLGIGLAKPLGVEQPCLAQEFTDQYGQYAPLPPAARVGETITVAGSVSEPVEFGGVGVSRLPPAQPQSAQALNSTNVYSVPEPHVMFFPAGFKTPKPVTVDGRSFTIDVSLDQGPGRYGISVWGRYPGASDLVMISLRVIPVS